MRGRSIPGRPSAISVSLPASRSSQPPLPAPRLIVPVAPAGRPRATTTSLPRPVVKFTALVRSIVQRVLGPGRREEWDDACQAVFLRVFANLGRWEQRCPFCKWLAVVAARKAIDVSRLPDAMERLPAAELADPRPPGCASRI